MRKITVGSWKILWSFFVIDPSKSDKKLVDCDPTTETTCKERFEDISRQLQQHLQQSKSKDAENIDERSNVESRKKKDKLIKDTDVHQIKPSSSNTQTQDKDGKTENYIPDVYFLSKLLQYRSFLLYILITTPLVVF